MPSAGFLSLLCSCLLGAQSQDARVAIAAVSTQSPIAASIASRQEKLISPSYLSAISGQLLVVRNAPAQLLQVPVVITSVDTANSAQAPTIIVSADDDSSANQARQLDQSDNSVTQSLAPNGVAYTDRQGQMTTVYMRPELRYTNIPIEMLNAANPIDRVAAVVSSNEGTPTSIDWNDNGRGVSVGIFQANQRVGELPELLHQLAVIPQGQQEIAGAFGTQAAAQIQENPEAIRQWRFSPKNSLGQGLQKLVHSSLFQKLQVAVLRHKVTRAAAFAADFGITSTAGVAVCADLTNQWGRAGAVRFLKAADSMRSEGGKVKAIVLAVSKGSQYGSRYQSDLQKLEGDGLSLNEPFIFEPTNDTIETSFNP